MANVALMLSMLTLLGLATNNTQISPGPERPREREKGREREVRYLTDGTRMISAWQLAPGMGSRRPQQLPAFSDL